MKKLGKLHQCSRLHEYLLRFWDWGNYPFAVFCGMISRITVEVIRWLTGYQNIWIKNRIYLILIYCKWLYKSITSIISYYIGLMIEWIWIHYELIRLKFIFWYNGTDVDHFNEKTLKKDWFWQCSLEGVSNLIHYFILFYFLSTF